MGELRRECGAADRKAVRKIAFHIHMQHDSEYLNEGIDLAVSLHRDFPALTQVIFLGLDENHDEERECTGKPQRRLNPKKTLITLSKPSCPQANRDIYGDLVVAVKQKYVRSKWICPEFVFMDYEKSNSKIMQPDSETYDNEVWKEYYCQLSEDREPWTSDEDENASDDEWEWI